MKRSPVVKWTFIVSLILAVIFGFIILIGDNMPLYMRLTGAGILGVSLWVLGDRCL